MGRGADQWMYDVGHRATRRLLERMSTDTDERLQQRLVPELVVRMSSGPSRADS